MIGCLLVYVIAWPNENDGKKIINGWSLDMTC